MCRGPTIAPAEPRPALALQRPTALHGSAVSSKTWRSSVPKAVAFVADGSEGGGRGLRCGRPLPLRLGRDRQVVRGRGREQRLELIGASLDHGEGSPGRPSSGGAAEPRRARRGADPGPVAAGVRLAADQVHIDRELTVVSRDEEAPAQRGGSAARLGPASVRAVGAGIGAGGPSSGADARADGRRARLRRRGGERTEPRWPGGRQPRAAPRPATAADMRGGRRSRTSAEVLPRPVKAR